MEHDLYKDGDENIPEVLLDRNGQVALAVCKVCNQAEVELEKECPSLIITKEIYSEIIRCLRLSLVNCEVLVDYSQDSPTVKEIYEEESVALENLVVKLTEIE